MKKLIRKISKEVIKLIEDIEYGREMDYLLDGSGECGKFIEEGCRKSFQKRFYSILEKYGVKIEEYTRVLAQWGNKEVEMCPTYKIRMFGKKVECPRSLGDTLYGNILEYLYMERI